MKRLFLLMLGVPVLAACSFSGGGTLAQLRDVEITIEEVEIEGGLEKAMASYQRFLEETPESQMTPEAIRRIADLKLESEYGYIQGAAVTAPPERHPVANVPAPAPGAPESSTTHAAVAPAESDQAFEERATATAPIAPDAMAAAAPADLPGELEDDLERAGALEAIELYQQLLANYPLYERNDQVLYQMSRAYEELGRVEDAMEVMNRIITEYPRSRYLDEVQFRRGEYFFTRNRFLDAEDAYQSVVTIGVSSSFFEIALYKLGWTFYKQDMYEEALHRFFAGLDHKISIGYDFDQPDAADARRIEDTFRVVSLGFSNLGGPNEVTSYFNQFGARSYEDRVYSNLGEYYLEKRRYSDGAAAYRAFVELNPFHRRSPHFHMRIIDIYTEGGFPRLVVDSKKEFAQIYGLHAEYWHHQDVDSMPEVVGHLKTNLKDLANHYHALYQDERFADEQGENYRAASHWYRAFLASFPRDVESPGINYQLADLLLEHKSYGEAAVEYERTAYAYPAHEQASAAGYAAVYAYRQHLETVAQGQRGLVARDVVRSSLKFADTFPDHEQAPVVLGAAADDLYEMRDYAGAVAAGRKLIANYPTVEQPILRAAWIAVAHGSFDLGEYVDAEEAYVNVLELTPADDPSRPPLYDNLAASIYKQGEQANTLQDYRAAADHFLRVLVAAPTSSLRAAAEYDASVALITLEDWDAAADVLVSFRQSYPGHELQPDVTNKLAFVYREAGHLAQAAAEYERVEQEATDDDIRRGALMLAAELYEEAVDLASALKVYQRYVGYFPQPIESAVETRFRIAEIHKENDRTADYLAELRTIVAADAGAGSARTDRTRYLAATSALFLAEPLFERFAAVELTKPFERNLRTKQQLMREALDGFAKLTEYEVGDVTAAATFYLAETYYEFARALMASERPDNLTALQLEEYELAIEDQAYPFEDESITVHEKNLELMTIGIYNEWIDKSLGRLATLVPVRYAKFEETTGFMISVEAYSYQWESELSEPEETDEERDHAAVGVEQEGSV